MSYRKPNEFIPKGTQNITDELSEDVLIETLPLKNQLLFKQFRKEGWAEKMPALDLIDIVNERAPSYDANTLFQKSFGTETHCPWHNAKVISNNSNNQQNSSYSLVASNQVPFKTVTESSGPNSNNLIETDFVKIDVSTPLDRLNDLNTDYLNNKDELNKLSAFEEYFFTSTATWKVKASQLRNHALRQCKTWVNEFKNNHERVQFLEEALKLPIINDRTGSSTIFGRNTPAYTNLLYLKDEYESRIKDMNITMANFASPK